MLPSFTQPVCARVCACVGGGGGGHACRRRDCQGNGHLKTFASSPDEDNSGLLSRDVAGRLVTLPADNLRVSFL